VNARIQGLRGCNVQTRTIWKETILNDNLEEQLFAMQKRRTARTMKIVIVLLGAVFLFVFYNLIQNG